MPNIEITKKKIGKPINKGVVTEGYSFIQMDYEFLWGGGGMGGGNGATQTALDRYTWQYDEDIFNIKTLFVLIKSLFAVWGSATWDGSWYEPNAGSEKALYIGISEDGNLTDDEIKSQTSTLGGPWVRDALSEWEQDITKFVIQPNNILWSKKIYITVAWFHADCWWYGSTTVPSDPIKFAKVDYEVGV